MAQATNSLSQSTLDTFQPISASAVHMLARLAAKKAVKERMRAEGRRISLVRSSLGMFEKPKRLKFRGPLIMRASS